MNSLSDNGRRQAIFLAALPHLLLAIFTALSGTYVGRVVSALGLLLLLVAAVAFLFAWRQGWPLWSGSWIGYWLLLLFPLGARLSLPGLELLILPALLAVGVLIFQRRPLLGLLGSSLPLVLITRVFVFELVAGGEWVWSGVWLLLAFTSAAIVWLGSVRAGTLLLIGFHVVAGVAFALARSTLPYRGLGQTIAREAPELERVVNDFVPLTLVVIAILLALLLLQPLRRLAAQGGRRGQSQHALLLLGMFLTLAGFFALRSQPRLLNAASPPAAAAIIASLAVAAGLVLSLGAAFLLTRVVWRDPRDRFHILLLPLLAAFAPLVVFALGPPFAPDGRYSDQFQTILSLSYAGVILWSLAALLVIVLSYRDGSSGLPGSEASEEGTSGDQNFVFRGGILAGLLWFYTIPALSACASATPEPATVVPAEVVFETPMAEIDTGVRLALHVDDWDGYGEAVEVRGDVLVVGASEWNYYGPGLAYVYRLSGGEWQEEAQLRASYRDDEQQSRRFGASVALGEGIVAIGAPGSDNPIAGVDTGAVYLFEHDGQSWVETAKLTPGRLDRDTAQTRSGWQSDFRRLRTFGSLVALDGATLAVASATEMESVYVFQRDEDGWQEQARIPVPGSPGRDVHMVSLALFGDTLALSAFYMPPQSNRTEVVHGSVVVYVFERDGDAWGENFRFIPEGPADFLFLRKEIIGASVALGGPPGQANLLAVGLPGFPDLSGVLEERGGVPASPEFPKSKRETGAVTIFERAVDGGWNKQATLMPASGENPPGLGFGFSESPGVGFDEVVYDESTSTFLPAFVFPGHSYSENPEITFFGATVDLDENLLAVTAGYANTAYVLERREQNWVYRFRVTAGPEAWEDYGQVVAINGRTLLLGAPGEFGYAAYVFTLAPVANDD